MNKDVEVRLRGLDYTIYECKTNLDILNYITFNLHLWPYNRITNQGLNWIWKVLLENQLLLFYRLMKRGNTDKFSFNNTIKTLENNLGKSLFSQVNLNLKELEKLYEENQFESIRNNHIAHLGLDVSELKTDLIKVKEFTQKVLLLRNSIVNLTINYKAIIEYNDGVCSIPFKKFFKKLMITNALKDFC